MSQVLNAEKVRETILECLFRKDEEVSGIPVKGLVRDFAFHPQRLAAQRETVKAMLREIADPFHQDSGGGWTFLNFCQTKTDDIWTGLQTSMEALMVLGIALGLVEELTMLPRELLPGGVPYIVIKNAVWK